MPVAIQSEEGQQLLEPLSADRRVASVHTVGFGGVHSGGDALIDIVGAMPRAGFLYKAAGAMPGLTRVSYTTIARRRALLGKLVGAAAITRADDYLTRSRSSSGPRSERGSPRIP
jgi:predicted DCC family thiol-disulfide oxidoreductase YuxK